MLGLAMDALATVKGTVLGVILNRVPTKGAGKVYYGYRYTGEYYRDENGAKHKKHRQHSSGGKTSVRSLAGVAASVAASGAHNADQVTGSTEAPDAFAEDDAREESVRTSVLPVVPDRKAEPTGSARVPRRLQR
ncbi:MAG: hypothetical protein LKI24_13725 [Acidipropionibacterium sp.]|jgi:hypothetical protein|nr:hypothetical protein [Acidipropionibacterium sp.]